MHNETGLYSAGYEEKISVDKAVFWRTTAATPFLCTKGATPMGNLLKILQNSEKVWIQEKVEIFYGSPLIPSLPNLLQTSNFSFCHKQNLELIS